MPFTHDRTPAPRLRQYGSRLAIVALLGLAVVFGSQALHAAPKGEGVPLTGVVEGEVARRQAQMLESEKFLVEGDDHLQGDDFEQAVLSYAKAYNTLTPSPMSDGLRASARERYSAASVLLAREYIKAAEFAKAGQVIDRVLDPAVDPDYQPARVIKKRLADPEWYNQARTPKHLKNVKDVERLLKLGAGAYEIADFDLALEYYTAVLRIDRYNTAARRGMEEAERAIIGYHKASRNHTRSKLLRDVAGAWETPVPLSDVVGADFEGSDVLGLGRGGARGSTVESKLHSLIVDQIEFDDTSLVEIVAYLSAKSREVDPEGEGVNFVLNLDPTDQAARAARLSLKLRNVPLGEVVKYITRDSRTNYRTDAFAVQIVSANSASTALLTKKFRVPPDFLSTAPIGDDAAIDDPFAAEPVSGRGLQLKRLGAKEFLMQQGVTFPGEASAVFIPGSSTLMVRNTANNLNLIETIIDNSYGGVPKQVEIYVTMIDIVEQELHELGFDWLLGKFNVPGSNRAFGSGGTEGFMTRGGTPQAVSAAYPFIPPGTNSPLGTHPITAGNRSGNQWRDGDRLDSILLNSGRPVDTVATNVAPGIFAVAGALTDPQFQLVIRAMSQAKSGDVLTRPSVVTRSGQRAVIDIIREFPYPTEYDPPEIPQSVGNNNNNNNFFPPGIPPIVGGGGPTLQNFPVTPAHPTAFETRPVGTHLEVEPIVGQDEYTVELNLTPELVRFEGFINYGSPISTSAPNALGLIENVPLTDNRILQPVFKTNRQNTSLVVWDGATVVMGGLFEERSQSASDKVPLFGDIPVLGRLFRSEGSERTRRAVIFFVKVHVIDPSGRRVNAR